MATTASAASPSWASAPAQSVSSRHTIVALVILAIIGGYFWQQSRYPALMKKLNKGTSVKVQGAITFDNVLAVYGSISFPQHCRYRLAERLHAALSRVK